MTFEGLMQKFVNQDYSDLLNFAKEAVNQLMPMFRKVDPEHQGNYMLSSIVLSAVMADGIITPLEKKLLKDVFALDDYGVQKLVSSYEIRMVELTNCFCDQLGENNKANTIMLFVCFAAVDEKISKEETALLRKLFE